jgi:uncharacterized secreted protein with C-terminal beta-propeller domain
VNSIAVVGSRAYYAGIESSIGIVDVSDPSKPVAMGTPTISGYAEDIAADSHFAYVAAWNQGLRIVDVSNPSNAHEVGSFNPSMPWEGQTAFGIAISGTTAYLADSAGLYVVDVADPTNPTQIGFYPIPGAHRVTLANGFIYVAAEYSGFWIIQMTTPSSALPPRPVPLRPIPASS